MIKTKSGFTIVELLIVIVVIAILASITIVAYSNIQQRARNTSIISSVSGWMNVLTISSTMNGTVGITLASGDNSLCLGTKEQYPAISADLGEGQCYINAHTSDEVEEIMNEIGAVSMTTYATDDGSHQKRGLQYWHDWDDDVSRLQYDLFGEDQECSVSGAEVVYNDDGVTSCEINVTEVIGKSPIVHN